MCYLHLQHRTCDVGSLNAHDPRCISQGSVSIKISRKVKGSRLPLSMSRVPVPPSFMSCFHQEGYAGVSRGTLSPGSTVVHEDGPTLPTKAQVLEFCSPKIAFGLSRCVSFEELLLNFFILLVLPVRCRFLFVFGEKQGLLDPAAVSSA